MYFLSLYVHDCFLVIVFVAVKAMHDQGLHIDQNKVLLCETVVKLKGKISDMLTICRKLEIWSLCTNFTPLLPTPIRYAWHGTNRFKELYATILPCVQARWMDISASKVSAKYVKI